MKLAYTMAPGRGDIDLILARLAEELTAKGVRCCGTVQINTNRPESDLCDMDVRILPDGPVLRISQDLGPDARGCWLDPSALETAVGEVAARLGDGCDLLIINKFGKHEADGRGFRHVIAEALGKEIAVLVGLNGLNEAAFQTFAGGMTEHVQPTVGALSAWVSTTLASDEAVG